MTLTLDRRMVAATAPMSRINWPIVFACFALLMSVNAFYALFQGQPTDLSSQKATVPSNRGNLLYVGLWLALYGTSGWLVLRNMLRNGIEYRFLAILPFATYILCSALWADNTVRSIVPAAMLTLNIIIATALAQTVGPVILLVVMARLNVVLIVISLVMLAIEPSSVLSDPTRAGLLMTGELFGAYGNKANLGTSASISIIILLFMPEAIRHRAWRGLALAILIVGVILSNSASSQAGGMVAAIVLVAARLMPALRKAIFAVACASVMIWSFILPFISLGSVTEVLGRSSDLTGRGTFWPMAPGFILERPYFGYGYMAFFDSGPYSRAWDIWKYELYWFTPEFHNTLLDILISLGLVGAFAYAVTLAISMAVFAHRTLDRNHAELLVGIIILLTIGAASEFKFLAHNSFPTIYLFYCFFIGGRRYTGSVPPALAVPPALVAAS